MAGITDLGAGIGSILEGGGYDTAAGYAKQNAELSKLSLGIQLQQEQRQAYKVIGGQKADVASGGLAAGGTAMNLLRSSTQQAGLQRGLVAAQGQININQWLEKYSSDKAQANAAYATGAADIFSFLGGSLDIGQMAGAGGGGG